VRYALSAAGRFGAASAFLSAAAHRLFVATTIRARPSGISWCFVLAAFSGAGGACDALGRLVERKRDRPFEAQRSRDENPDAVPERVRGDPGYKRLRGALAVAPALSSSSPA
jgi:hypothetical protein